MSSVDETSIADDLCIPFQIENADVRGQIVRLGPAIDEVLSKHDYPLLVSNLVGELLALAVMFGTSLKFEGKLSLQIKGDGPISMVVADFFSPDTIRAYAQYKKDDVQKLEQDRSAQDVPLREMIGKGHFALVIDQGPDTEQYQGFVPLEGNSVGECVQGYFAQSEQIATSVRASVAKSIVANENGSDESWRAGAIMVQHLPQSKAQPLSGEEDPKEIWNRVNILLNTTEDHELLDPTLSSQQLLFRLYHEDGVRVFDERHVQAGCSCDRERVLAVLKGFEPTERNDLIVDGSVDVTCEFCNATYDFKEAELE
jgi:molecular chaperone Hsp33